MNQIQQLINQMCPNGVEWKTLGEVCDLITKGTTPHSFTDNGVMFIKTEALLENSIDINKLSFIDEETHNGFLKRSILKENDILFAIAGSIGKCTIVKKSFLPANTNQALAIIRLKSSALHRFVFYVLKSNLMASYIEKKSKTSGQPNLTLELIRDFQIPLPPLAIQTRIVEILDHFTNLTANLTAELNLRRKQFEHYREKLLSLDGVEGVEWKKLGEVAEIKRGKRLTTKQLDTENGFPVYHGGIEPIGFYYSSNRPANTVMVINVGASAGTVGFCDVDFWSSDGCFCICQNDSIRSKYLFYHLIGCEHQLKTKVRHAGIPTLDNKVVESVTIPIPPLATQHSIVSILDKFTALIENIEKELALRQKQYEYYREELLRFGG